MVGINGISFANEDLSGMIEGNTLPWLQDNDSEKIWDKWEVELRDFIIFDPRCLHCTQYNDTKDTRISMDIRIIMKSELKKYSRAYKTTGRKKMPFMPGHYFSKEAV